MAPNSGLPAPGPRWPRPTVGCVSLHFFHVVEQEDGSWSCRRGREDFGWFDVLEDAIDHITAVANKNPPSVVLVHRLDGQVRRVALLAEPGPP